MLQTSRSHSSLLAVPPSGDEGMASSVPKSLPLTIASGLKPLSATTRFILCCSENRLQSSRPFSMFTKAIAIIAAVQMANKKGNPIQLFLVSLMMAWMTLGPMMEDLTEIAIQQHGHARIDERSIILTARLVMPNKAKNMLSKSRGMSSLIMVWAYCPFA